AGMDDDVVRAVQRFAVPGTGERLRRVGIRVVGTGDAPAAVLADEQASSPVQGHAVRPAAGLAVDLGAGLSRAPAVHGVPGDVAEHERVVVRDPDGAFGEAEAAAELALLAGEELGDAIVVFDVHSGRDS